LMWVSRISTRRTAPKKPVSTGNLSGEVVRCVHNGPPFLRVSSPDPALVSSDTCRFTTVTVPQADRRTRAPVRSVPMIALHRQGTPYLKSNSSSIGLRLANWHHQAAVSPFPVPFVPTTPSLLQNALQTPHACSCPRGAPRPNATPHGYLLEVQVQHARTRLASTPSRRWSVSCSRRPPLDQLPGLSRYEAFSQVLPHCSRQPALHPHLHCFVRGGFRPMPPTRRMSAPHLSAKQPGTIGRPAPGFGPLQNLPSLPCGHTLRPSEPLPLPPPPVDIRRG
jgi:hypothetical protein